MLNFPSLIFCDAMKSSLPIFVPTKQSTMQKPLKIAIPHTDPWQKKNWIRQIPTAAAATQEVAIAVTKSASATAVLFCMTTANNASIGQLAHVMLIITAVIVTVVVAVVKVTVIVAVVLVLV